MCGILGVVQPEPVSPDWLRRSQDIIHHRGPDGGGQMIDGGVGLAMRRLSIIDLECGAQPMHSPDGNLSLIFNGEIYNYRKLRHDLQSSYAFQTYSDTEVILAAYKMWGDEGFARLNGMYAIALYDRRRRVVILARDPVGIKPLYWWVSGHKFVFGSELKLFTKMGVARQVSTTALSQYLTSGYVFHPHTALAGVRQLSPGSLLEISLDGKYALRGIPSVLSRPARSFDPVDGDVAAPLIIKALADAVERQMVADVPVGLLLSGGLDSMLILSSLHERHLTEDLETFTVSFDEPSFSEREVVERTARLWGFRNMQVTLTGDQVAKSLDSVCYACDNLELLPTSVAIYFASHLAGQHGKVVLAGNGGDELFAGYPTYLATETLMRLGSLHTMLAPARALINVLYRGSSTYLSRSERLARFLEGSRDRRPELAHLRWRHVFRPDELAALLAPDAQPPNPVEILSPQLAHYEEAQSLGWEELEAMIYTDLRSWLVDCNLSMWDKTGMSASLEIRVPLLDLEFMSTVLSVPLQHRGRPTGTKRFLRDAARNRLPEAVRTMAKHGFQVPIAAWLRGPLRRPIEEATRALPASIFQPRAINDLWRSFDQGHSRLALPLWLLGCCSRWSAMMGCVW